MTHLITRSRHMAIAVIAAAALLGSAALLAVSAAPASAELHVCPDGEFCLYFDEFGDGGYYHFDRSDSNLSDDNYEGGDTGEIVADTSRYAINAGIPGPKDDVVVYSLPGYKGARDCVELDFNATLPRKWWNNIESYRWVTDAQCAAAGPIIPPVGGAEGGGHPVP